MPNDYIAHYGVKRRSGRYPWGSGERPYQSDPKKAKLFSKYETKEKAAIQKRDDMVLKGKKPIKISDHEWRSDVELDDITRKLLRLEAAEAARELGVYDKKLSNAAADYEWGKKLAKQYDEKHRYKSKTDMLAVSRASTFGAIVGGPLMAAIAITLSPGQGVLRGSDYYEKVARKAEAILKKKVPNDAEDMLKMFEDRKG